MKRTHASHGYIALVSALIISAILGTLALTESTSIFWTRFAELDVIQTEQSHAAASSCGYEAALAYAEDPTLTTPFSISLGPNTVCTVEKTSTTGDLTTLYVLGTYSHIPTRIALQINTQTNPISITSWKEVTSVPP